MNEVAGRALHDKTTRGQELSLEERKQLNAWYTEVDRTERLT